MHFRDIYEQAKQKSETRFLRLEIDYQHTNIFVEKKHSLIRNAPLQEPAQDGDSYIYRSSAIYDHGYLYPDDNQRAVVLMQTRYLAHTDARYLESFIAGRFDVAIIFVHEPYSIFLAEGLQSRFRIRVIPVIMDTPQLRIETYKIGERTARVIDNAFIDVVRNAYSILSASRPGAETLDSLSNQTKAYPAYPVVRSTRRVDTLNLARWSGEIRVVLVGQAYAPESLGRFMVALSKYQQQTAKKVSFHFFGEEHGRHTFERLTKELRLDNVEMNTYEYLPHNELQEILSSTYTIGYVPYPDSPALSETVRYSFPSKFVSYIEAGLVPLYDGPRNSTVHNLLEDLGLDFLSVRNKHGEIDLATFLKSVRSHKKNMYIAFEQVFSKQKLGENIMRAIYHDTTSLNE
jgi:hypothetical protein